MLRRTGLGRGQALLTRYTIRRSVLHRPTHPRWASDAHGSLDPPTVVDDVSVSAKHPPRKTREGWFYVDSVFPIRLGALDIRHYIGRLTADNLLAKLTHIFAQTSTLNFKAISLEPDFKDGGVFVKFTYALDAPDERVSTEDVERALSRIQASVRQAAGQEGGIPSWWGYPCGNVWLVRGHPWREDMRRYASPVVKVAFEGPDVQEEELYRILRPYGIIEHLEMPTTVPAGTPRTAIIAFRNFSAATTARNVVHGFEFVPGGSAPMTRLRTSYRPPVESHQIRDWISKHPRLFAPVLIFLLGTITYTIFDPIRTFMIESRVNGLFDYRSWQVWSWMSRRVDRFANSIHTGHDDQKHEDSAEHLKGMGEWKARTDAIEGMERYLTDLPSTVAFVHGPQGSGKSHMLAAVVSDKDRKSLVIDCDALFKKSSDSQVVATLAGQTGYWPIFPFLDSVNNMIDLASVGIIGQKAGLSASLPEQLKQVLDSVSSALHRVSASYRKHTRRRLREEQHMRDAEEQELRRRARVLSGVWHDGRLDCAAGNGVMSELGIGDEPFLDSDMVSPDNRNKQEPSTDKDTQPREDESGTPSLDHQRTKKEPEQESEPKKEVNQHDQSGERKKRSVEDVEMVNALPVVIIRNYAMRAGAKDEVMDAIASWAASLAENQVAHVVVISDNRENSKRLAKALPTKPLNMIPFYDADSASAHSFVKQKLHDAGIDVAFTREDRDYLERLGGRASDLESMIHKVRNGQSAKEAVLDIIRRDVGELRKNAFGDDAEDAKGLPWTREQAWTLVKKLAEKPELPYFDILVNFPFKGDEAALRSMEHAELVTITANNGRPVGIRPGKPVFKYVFQEVASDRVFAATQDLAVNEKLIASAESTVKLCEEELLKLKDIRAGQSTHILSSNPTQKREEYLFKKMKDAEAKTEQLEKQNVELRKTLTKLS